MLVTTGVHRYLFSRNRENRRSGRVARRYGHRVFFLSGRGTGTALWHWRPSRMGLVKSLVECAGGGAGTARFCPAGAVRAVVLAEWPRR